MPSTMTLMIDDNDVAGVAFNDNAFNPNEHHSHLIFFSFIFASNGNTPTHLHPEDQQGDL